MLKCSQNPVFVTAQSVAMEVIVTSQIQHSATYFPAGTDEEAGTFCVKQNSFENQQTCLCFPFPGILGLDVLQLCPAKAHALLTTAHKSRPPFLCHPIA